MQYFQEDVKSELPSMGNKRVAVIIGRFSPPTAGHYSVISAVKKYIRKHPGLNLQASPIVAIIGGSKSDQDKSRNPLTTSERETFMKASGRANGVTFITAVDAFKAFESLRERGLEPIVIAAGSDRIQGYKGLLDKYFKTPDGSDIKHHLIELTRDDEAIKSKKDEKTKSLDSTLDSIKNNGDIDVKNISGSLARRAVELGYESEFAKIVGLQDKPTLARKMFNKIKQSIKS